MDKRFHFPKVEVLGDGLVCATDAGVAKNFIVPADYVVDKSRWQSNTIMGKDEFIVTDALNGVVWWILISLQILII